MNGPAQLGLLSAPPEPVGVPDRDRWRTPAGVWRAPLALLGRSAYDLDAASEPGLSLPAARILTVEDDALTCSWACPRRMVGLALVWVNAPFSKGSGGKLVWARRAIDQARQHNLLVAVYLPVTEPTDPAGSWTAALDLACTVRISIAGRVVHGPPRPGMDSSPQAHAHAIWLVGPEGFGLLDLPHNARPLMAWDWRRERWLSGSEDT